MKNIFLVLILSLFSCINYAQNKPFILEDYAIKVRAIKSDHNKVLCSDTTNCKRIGFVADFEVINDVDIKRFGNRIYAIDICYNYPGDGVFNPEQIWDLKISEQKYYLKEIKIVNEELLFKNVGGKKYYIRDLSRKYILYEPLVKKDR
ncbi:hypothetical protein [Flavobacterium sp. CLA17]|uniref:hypothetical protein n=1 Tax=Flavobacterium sp. CLA17 TaxID=2724135 RepID=UPI001491C1D8|nr:hypothetical protein [Flavobacterium sp. CLA17]QSB26571.1 hypothetical protein HAV12_019750 [Flavobacterium sp. CLA17]